MKKLLFMFLILILAAGCVKVSDDGAVVLDKPVIKLFSATPAALSPGEFSTLSWSVLGATGVSIDQGVGSVALNGSTSVKPETTTVYTLTATNSFGTSTATTRVSVAGSPSSAPPSVTVDKPVLHYFTASPTSITSGGSTTLAWKITGATNISITPEIGPADPEISITVFPTATTTYILAAGNSVGTVTQSVTVTVTPASVTPPPTSTTPGQPLVLSMVAEESGSLVKNSTSYIRQTGACAGDTTGNVPTRAFLSFDISSIPANAVVNEAVLDFGDYLINGNPSYSSASWGNMGALEIYTIQYTKFDDPGRIAYESPQTSVTSLRLSADSSVPISVDVTTASNGNNIVQSLRNDGQTRCQFRIQMFTSTNWDSKADSICLDNARLRVKYSSP